MKKQIMIVDDDPTSVAIVKAMLVSEYDVVTNASGLQAMGHLQRNGVPDLILLDIVMPGMGGMEFLKYLKDDPKLAEIPVIFMTGMDRPEIQLEGYVCGVDDFIQKPVNEKLLELKIARQLYIYTLKQENKQLKEQRQMIKMRIDQVLDAFSGILP